MTWSVATAGRGRSAESCGCCAPAHGSTHSVACASSSSRLACLATGRKRTGHGSGGSGHFCGGRSAKARQATTTRGFDRVCAGWRTNERHRGRGGGDDTCSGLFLFLVGPEHAGVRWTVTLGRCRDHSIIVNCICSRQCPQAQQQQQQQQHERTSGGGSSFAAAAAPPCRCVKMALDVSDFVYWI